MSADRNTNETGSHEIEEDEKWPLYIFFNGKLEGNTIEAVAYNDIMTMPRLEGRKPVFAQSRSNRASLLYVEQQAEDNVKCTRHGNI